MRNSGYHIANVRGSILSVSLKAKGPERPHASELVDIRETRKANLLTLIAEQAQGSVVRFAEMVGLEGHSYFSRIVGPKGSRNLGHIVARRIERAFGLERGWMDKDHGASATASSQAHRLSPRAMELARRIDTLPEPAQDHVERMIDSIAGLVGKGPRGRGRRRRRTF